MSLAVVDQPLGPRPSRDGSVTCVTLTTTFRNAIPAGADVHLTGSTHDEEDHT